MGDVIQFEHNTFDHGSIGYKKTENYYSPQSADSDVLEELRKIQLSLEKTAPLIADALGELSTALKKHEQSRVDDIVKKLSGEVIVDVLAGAVTEAGKTALRMLGLPL